MGESLGTTNEERFLISLARRSFLRFWSWPNLYRDQGDNVRGGDGKEICDLVVIFGCDVLLFSDKKISYCDKKDTAVAWPRWARQAIGDSIKQLNGAQRWLMEFPSRIFLDKFCDKKLPIDVPCGNEVRFHRIVVTHGIESTLAKVLNEPSFAFSSKIVRKETEADAWDDPYTIPQICMPDFIHVFNEFTIGMVLGEFDTAKDFVDYLVQRKKLLTSECRLIVQSESDIVQLYYEGFDKESRCRFIEVPKAPEGSLIVFNKGGYASFCRRQEIVERKASNSVSYFWDDLIENFSHHILNNSTQFRNWEAPSDVEPSLRFLAQSGRFIRRVLSKSFIDFYNKVSPGQRGTRLYFDPDGQETAYLFFLLPHDDAYLSIERYREIRHAMLQEYCHINKFLKPELKVILGIAARTRVSNDLLSREFFSEGQDFIYCDFSVFTQEMLEEAKEIHDEYVKNRFIAERRNFTSSEHEFPERHASFDAPRQCLIVKGAGRNLPCPCGSGKKVKKCCGRH